MKIEKGYMISSIRDRFTSQPVSASPKGTTMLKKRTRMTLQEAYDVGKLGKADLHMHSIYSDGTGSIEQILDHIQYATDLDVVALTDHDVIEGALRARDLWARG